jgi:hypothetical protein
LSVLTAPVFGYLLVLLQIHFSRLWGYSISALHACRADLTKFLLSLPIWQEARAMFPEYAATAREEGFEEIAELFEMMASVSDAHEQRFLIASEALANFHAAHA